MLKYVEAIYGISADEMSDKLLGWDAMMTRKSARAAVRNAQAIEWVRTHTVRDLEYLAGEMRSRGEDVRDIIGLLGDLREIDKDLCLEAELVPTACE